MQQEGEPQLLQVIFLLWDKLDSSSKKSLRATCRELLANWRTNVTKVQLGETEIYKAGGQIDSFFVRLFTSSPDLVRVKFLLSAMPVSAVHSLFSMLATLQRQITVCITYKSILDGVGVADAGLLSELLSLVNIPNVRLKLSLDLKLAEGPESYLMQLVQVVRSSQVVKLKVTFKFGYNARGSVYSLYIPNDYKVINLARLEDLEELVLAICESPALVKFTSVLDRRWVWAERLESNIKLQSLSVDFVTISSNRSDKLAERIANGAFPALRELSFFGRYGSFIIDSLNQYRSWVHLKCLQTIDLGLCLTDEKAGYLTCLTEMVQLETLGLRYNNFTEKGAKTLVPVLRSLSSLTCLDLGENPWRSAGAIVLSEALPSLTKLTELLLDNSKMEGDGACIIAMAMAPSIECLNFQSNRIKDTWAISLGCMVSNLPNISLLAMEWNPMTLQVAEKVRRYGERGVPIRFELDT